jgi:hypothetical protein
MTSIAREFREHVKEAKFVEHRPYEMGSDYKQGSLVRIAARVSDTIVELDTSYLRISGTCYKADGTSAVNHCYATNGFAGGLFSEIRLYLGGSELLETCRSPLFMSMFNLYMTDTRESYDTTNRLFPGFSKNNLFFKNNRFELYVPLRYFLSVCRDYKEPIFFSDLELALQISNNNFVDCFARERVNTGQDGNVVMSDSTETTKLNIEDISWHLKHIHLENSAQTKVLNSINKGLKQTIEFNRIEIYSIPPLPTTANTARLPIKCYSQMSAPLFVVVGFSENRIGNLNLDSSVMEDVVIDSVVAWLNSDSFPQNKWIVNRAKNESGCLYKAYCDFCKMWQNSENVNYTLNRKEFDENFQVFVIPTPVKKNIPIVGSLDVSIEIFKNNNFLPLTNVTIWVGQKQRWQYDAVRSELSRIE